MSLSGGGAIAAGLVLVVIAGCLNGSWNASFSPTHGYAVGRITEQRPDLSYHLAWILFQVYAAVINIPICLYWAGGPARVQYIVQQSSALEIGMICVFSILWGVGSIGFGLACKVAGVGLGTNLCMGIIMILGTFLPLCLEGVIATAAGGMVVAGLGVCCGGLWASVQSLQLRDVEEREHRIRRRTLYNTTVSIAGDTVATAAATGISLEQLQQDAMTPGQLDQKNKLDDQEQQAETQPVDDDEGPSTFHKVAVCVIAGIFATQLQFAFVFGDEMIALAEDSSQGPGFTPPSGTSAVIWLFAISLGAPVSIIYGLYSNPSNIPLTWLYQCPWYRHPLVLITTSLPWVSHIHLYGYANTYLPPELAASVAWPILMMMTVVAGMIWSICLGEWKLASEKARLKLYYGLGLVTIGVGVIMASVAV